MTSRDESAKATQQKLLRTADRLIREKGYENISVEDITTASGVAKGTFYRHFKRKEDLILVLSRNRFSAITNQTVDLTEVDVLGVIRQYIIDFMKVITKSSDVELARQWVRYIALPGNADGKWNNDLEGLTNLINRLIAMHRISSDIPIEKLVQLVFTQLYGIVLIWCFETISVDPIQQAELYCDLQIAPMIRPYILK